MSALKGAYRTAVGLGFIAVLAGATACGQSAPASTPTTTASPSAAPSSTGTPTTAPTTSASATTTQEPAGADASAAQAPADPGDGAVDGPAVAESVSTQLTKIVGRAPDNVTCADLPAKVGAAIRCVLTDGSDKYGVTVTATSVQGSNVAFDIKVDDQPS